jgi:beta-xylosidase
MTPDGKALIPESDTILHQSNGSEANKLFKHNGTYYHYFSEVKAEGRVPMMGRAKNILGPYERRQIGHVNYNQDKEPNQGGIVQIPDGSWWFFTHHGSGDWSGRCASLLPVTWIDGWPIIGKPGADGIGNMVWSGRMPIQGTEPATPQTDDEFSTSVLPPQWEWHYHPRSEKWSLTEHPGFLRLHAFKPLAGDNLVKVGNILTQRSMRTSSNVVTTRMEISGMADGQRAGLCHLGAGGQAAVGVIQQHGKRSLFFRSGSKHTAGSEVSGSAVWLRTTWGLDGIADFSFSINGDSYQAIGEPFQMTWSAYRGDRIGLFSYNSAQEAGYADFDWFHYDYSGPVSASKHQQPSK